MQFCGFFDGNLPRFTKSDADSYGTGVPKKNPISVRSIKHRRYKFQVAVPAQLDGGKRERKYFVTRKEAQGFADALRVRQENFGTRLLQVPEPLRQEALDCTERLKPLGVTLSEAVTFFIQHRLHAQKNRTVSELVVSVLAAKTASGRAKRYQNDLRLICGDFARSHGGRMASEITPEDVECWVANDPHCATTRNTRLRTLSIGVLLRG